MSDYLLQLPAPARIQLVSADGAVSVYVDVYEAWRFVNKCINNPTEDKRWDDIRTFIADKLGVSVDTIGENTARQFNDVVISIGLKVQDELKKTCAEIVSSPTSTPALAPPSSAGPT